MALGSAADWSRLGPLGFVEICGNPDSGLLASLGAHLFAYAGMLAAMAVAVAAEASRRRSAGAAGSPHPWLHGLAMAAGMAAADLAAPALPGPLTPGLALLMMSGGMIAGMIAAHGPSALAAAGRRDFRSMIRMGG